MVREILYESNLQKDIYIKGIHAHLRKDLCREEATAGSTATTV